MLARIARTLTGHPDAHRALEQELASLRVQRDALAAERDSLKDHLERLDRELEDARRQSLELAAALSQVSGQRGALVDERDALRAHLERLDRELADAYQRAAAIDRDRQETLEHAQRLLSELAGVEGRLASLAQERDELKGHASNLQAALDEAREQLDRCGPFAPGSFYSPIVDPRSPYVRRAFDFSLNADPLTRMPGWNESRVVALFERWAVHATALDLPETPRPASRYFLSNPFFAYGDGLAYAGMLLEFHPARVVEIGCGFSSCLAMDLNDRCFGGRASLRFIEPFPDALLARLSPADPYRSSIAPIPLQDAVDEWFRSLQPGDICFYDGSHVVKTGSDAHDFYFRILPLLAPGVVIHIHDVFHPFEYPQEWVLDDRRSWNELYLLRALLEGNHDYEILAFNDYLYRVRPDIVAPRLPLALKNNGSSLWLRKLR
ncbi:MAG: class I SAM-dependent methyltransferase [Bryobacteraceae bacterium]